MCWETLPYQNGPFPSPSWCLICIFKAPRLSYKGLICLSRDQCRCV